MDRCQLDRLECYERQGHIVDAGGKPFNSYRE